MKRVLAYFRRNLVFRVLIIYAATAYIVVQIVRFTVSSSWLPEKSIRTTEALAIAYLPLALVCASAMQRISRADRTLFLKQMLWAYGPVMLLTGVSVFSLVSLFYEGPYSDPPSWKFIAMFMLLVVAAIAWMLMSAKVARAWARERAQDPERLYLAESLFLVSDHQLDFEVRISRKAYYMFLASIAVFIIFLVETFASEFFDDNLSIPGYFGAFLTAIIIAVLIYPVHRRVLQFIAEVNALEEDEEAEASIENPVLAASEVARATTRYIKTEFKKDLPRGQGCLIVLATILLAILLAVVKLHPYFNG